MKVKKSVAQRNVTLNTYYYSLESDIRNMLDSGEAWYIKEEEEKKSFYDYCGRSYDEYIRIAPLRPIRIDLEKGDELKVIDKDGSYVNILIKKDTGKEYIVEL